MNSEPNSITLPTDGKPNESVGRVATQIAKARAGDEAERMAFDQRQRAQRCSASLAKLEEQRGQRYVGCRLENFDVRGNAAEATTKTLVLNQLRAYCETWPVHRSEGYGVTLLGPCGTGKDHLAYAVAREFVLRTASTVEYVDGMTLFERLRDSFRGDGKSESELVAEWKRCGLLLLSDPLPVRGELTDYQCSALFRILDARYSNLRPTIITANVKPGEAETRFGSAIADRLRHSSLVIHCNWPSYRKANR